MHHGERELREEAERLGLTIVGYTKNKHIKATMRRPDGSTFTAIYSLTPSDHRSHLNLRSKLRRLMRAQ